MSIYFRRVIVLVYVDNTLLFSPNDAYVDDVISKLQQSYMELEVEDSVAGFLGVHIECNTLLSKVWLNVLFMP
jgi:hypothetical protein